MLRYDARVNIRRRLAAGLLLLPLAFVSAACVGVTRPQGWASPAIDGSSAFILEDKDRLTALELTDSNTANVRWSFPDDDKADQQDIDLEAIYAQPQIDGDVLYTVGYSGELVAIDVESGDLVRIRDFPGNVAGNLVLDNSQIALATTEGHLYLVNADNFTPADGWDQAGVVFDDDIWADPVVTEDRIFVATMEGDIIGVDRANGQEVWRQDHDGAIPTLALLDDSNLFAGSLSKDVMIIDPATGEFRMEFEAEDWVWNTPAFADGIAYFGDFSGKVYALDITTGQMAWPQPYDGGSKMKSGPVIIDDVLVVADRQPTVHFIRLSDGAGQNQVPLPEDSGTVRADLVVHEGTALVLTTDGRLFAADPSTAPGRVDEITYGGGQ
jgi:outer membrane protein assembly factor BamB